MCTVTYLPLNSTSFILTSSRDERRQRRAALPPAEYLMGECSVHFPKDPEKGGTWVATSKTGFTLCLLNGAYETHVIKESYRISRGIMLLDFFLYQDVQAFAREYNFEGIEPFTLIITDHRGDIQLYELRWDEKQVSLKEKDASKPAILSSVTLYPCETIQKHEMLFSDWLQQHPEKNQEDIIAFHGGKGRGDAGSIPLVDINDNVLTQSITSIIKEKKQTEMRYLDLITNEKFISPVL